MQRACLHFTLHDVGPHCSRIRRSDCLILNQLHEKSGCSLVPVAATVNTKYRYGDYMEGFTEQAEVKLIPQILSIKGCPKYYYVSSC